MNKIIFLTLLFSAFAAFAVEIVEEKKPESLVPSSQENVNDGVYYVPNIVEPVAPGTEGPVFPDFSPGASVNPVTAEVNTPVLPVKPKAVPVKQKIVPDREPYVSPTVVPFEVPVVPKVDEKPIKLVVPVVKEVLPVTPVTPVEPVIVPEVKKEVDEKKEIQDKKERKALDESLKKKRDEKKTRLRKKKKERKNKNRGEFDLLLQKSSLFHTESEINRVQQILDALSRGDYVVEKKENKSTKKLVKTKESRGSISFYLSSIMYFSENRWSIWLNGEKVVKGKESREIEVVNVNKRNVTFRWKTGYSVFVNTLLRESENGKLPEQITVDIKDNIATITFTLRPNQTFSLSNGVSVYEGK